MNNPTTKTALITSASRGIGQQLAKRFAADGYNLVLIARNDEDLQIALSRGITALVSGEIWLSSRQRNSLPNGGQCSLAQILILSRMESKRRTKTA